MRRSGRPALLALRALGLGDLLTAVPALRALARGFAEHRLVVATPKRLAPLALHAGIADEVLAQEGLAPLDIQPPSPDVAVNLHGRGPESHRVLLATGPRRFIAFAHEEIPETSGKPELNDDEHEAKRWCRLVSEMGINADPNDLSIAAPSGRTPSFARGATVVHPGAASLSRRWPAERWADVAQAESARGRSVILTGSASEIALARFIARRAGLGPHSVYAGRTDVLELASLVAVAGRVVSGDTGIAHLATALGTPSVVLFGPVSPNVWGPPHDRLKHRVLWNGRTGDPTARTVDPGLLSIGPDEVIAALEELPAS
jgi:ADP-heptose:LPS heptosyltransferase